jgi:membrane dipeptidase
MGQPVFDYFPPGTPRVTNTELLDTIKDTIDAGNSARIAWEAYENEQVRQLQSKPEFRNKLRDVYDDAGVTILCTTHWSLDPDLSFQEGVLTDLARWNARFDSVNWLQQATSPTTARQMIAQDKIVILSTVQNIGKFTDGRIDKIDTLYNAGVRIGQLTYNKQNSIGTGCTEISNGGLTYHGIDVVHRMNECGMIVDLSHCGTKTTLDAIEKTSRPPAFTHTFGQKLSDHKRGKSEEELKALKDNDGYMGVLALPSFIAPNKENPDLDDLLDHIDYATSILGTDRVGIGTDWGMTSPDVPEPLHSGLDDFFTDSGFRDSKQSKITVGEGLGTFQRYQDWPVIIDGLEERGYSEAEIRGITGENFLDFWERAI